MAINTYENNALVGLSGSAEVEIYSDRPIDGRVITLARNNEDRQDDGLAGDHGASGSLAPSSGRGGEGSGTRTF